ncbi:branched-chain amino acid ABC transporter permease [Nocardioides sp. R-C-SC26]|uniref:branched-chain amino acid ABC transporter permease n=1 Tax=Nocardioides sp. R-C-SC26 TaxID=2870414 RepID=UPI001E526CE8|nr:branched-chain amino acid ABC transporter permease [Nocardioides sp. R-C-SC26]
MTELLTAVSNGVGQGAVYVLLALGFVIIYKSSHVISFAQPSFMMAGAVLVSHLTPKIGFWAAAVIGPLLIGLVALVVERLVIRPMVGKAVFVIAIITIGVDIVVRVVTGAFLGVDPRVIGDPWGLDTVTVGGVQIEHRHIAALVTMTVVVMLLIGFFRFTRLGLATRAAALDQEAAMAQGVNVGTVFAVSWGLAGVLAALAGIFASGGQPLDQNLWVIALAALPVIILGGLDSLGGAVVAGLLIGVVESVVRSYHRDWFPGLDGNTGSLAPYVVMLLVLLVRPQGLFGTKEVQRV